MANLKQVKYTLEHLDVVDGDMNVDYIDKAVDALKTVSEALNTIGVRGRENLDKLLGVMLAIDMILGENETKG